MSELPVKKSRDEHRGGASEYDLELGRRMGEDARRVAAGEMTQSEFYAKYHEDVLEEFGEDERDPGLEGEGIDG
ncbi:4Fe-4S ferredoxin N-terminal domain-containing protein [Halapricum hydrolyticum]|uniref:4Fe-4S ferredoxin iron-sulfur binding domain-containing protein n=1 Tax=Halapricum hydrolyticum TaxID=2979991 RepID=A0AAE3IC38_9EURY|nr:4Fe-4S ferredoxin N-terminal domain-containing protein [Halapricum hydrolyticum]MCU4718281.1 hypothetical protein [Halapricum hydrolyticum]MCU4727271.1 hypothetical protein [Halapricum hydrolyticum]